jgi:hypothetical protein
MIRSFSDKRSEDSISLDKNFHFKITSLNGPQITRFEVNNDRLTPSQSSLIDEAMHNGWDSAQREKLEKFLTSRNVFKNKAARKYTLHIRKLIRDGERSKIREIFDDIEAQFKDIEKSEVSIVSINTIHGFAKDN